MEQTSVVTGGAGFIGSNLVHALLARGDRVRVFDDLSSGRAVNLEDVRSDIEVMDGDVRDVGSVARAIDGAAVVFHQAAIPSVARSVADPMSSNDVNVTGTLNVLVAARDAAVERVVYASSAAVYGNADALPLHEGMLTRPASPYGVSKLAGERYVEAFTLTYGLPTVALRYLNVFGPRQNARSEYASAIPRFISCTLGGDAPTIFGDGEQARDFVFVDDVVQANLLAAEASAPAWGRAFNVGRGERRTVNELLDAIRRLVPGEHPAPVHAPPRPGEVRDSWSDISAAHQVLGYEPAVAFEEGLRRTIERIASEGSL
jgi:UDP-glucose 4-epimerase